MRTHPVRERPREELGQVVVGSLSVKCPHGKCGNTQVWQVTAAEARMRWAEMETAPARGVMHVPAFCGHSSACRHFVDFELSKETLRSWLESPRARAKSG